MRAEATDGLGFAPPALAAPSAEPLAGPFAGTSDAAFAELLAASAEAAFAGASAGSFSAPFAGLLGAALTGLAAAAFAGASDAAFAAPGALEIFLAFFTDLRFVTTRFAPDRARRAYSGAMTSTPPM